VKEIQFGRNETISDMKTKLIRCLNYIMLEKDHIQLVFCEFRIYIPQFDDKKEEILRCIINCGKNEFFNFSGEEIKNDNEFIYVILLVKSRTLKSRQKKFY
jgi:hypothetical protein